MSSDKELFSQYFEPSKIPELNFTSAPIPLIGLDTSTGTRNNDLNKYAEGIVKTGDMLEVPKLTNIEAFDEYFGGNIPTQLKSIRDGATNLKRLIPKDKELINKGKETYLVPKDRPKGVRGAVASFLDFIDPTKDRDMMGKGFGSGTHAIEGEAQKIDTTDPALYEFKPGEQKAIDNYLESTTISKQESALSDLEDKIALNKKISEANRIESRKDRRMAGIDAQLQYALSEPVRQFFNERAARTRLGLEKEFAGFKESLPSAQQAIMSEKQKQQYLASAGFAAEAEAIAKQQEASKREDPRSYGQFASRA